MRYPSIPTIFGLCLASVVAVGEVADAGDRDKAQTIYRDFATLECDGSVSGIGGKQWPSGFTVVPIHTGDAGSILPVFTHPTR